jgi:hypothetical protein
MSEFYELQKKKGNPGEAYDQIEGFNHNFERREAELAADNFEKEVKSGPRERRSKSDDCECKARTINH